MPGRRGWRTLLALWAAVLFTQVARSQDGDAARPDAAWSGGAHTWLVFEDGEGGAVLAHCPPRRAGREGAFAPSEPGTLRVARRLATLPRGGAGVGDEVFLLFPPGVDRPAYVASIRAAAPAMGDYWVYLPQRRLTPLPPLPEGFNARSIVATGAGPGVVGRLNGEPAVCVLADGAWTLAPAEGLGPTALPLGSDGAGVVFLRPAAGGGGERVTVWGGGERERLAVTLPRGDLALVAGWAGRGRTVVIARAGDELRAYALSEGEPELIGTIGPVPERVTTGISVGGGAVIAAWGEEDGAPGSVELVELSLTTGAELYRGGAVNAMPISAAQFRLLAASLVALMAIVLLIVLVPAPDTPVTLPTGASLAEPGRRLVATVIDGLIAAFIVSVIYGVPVLHILTFRVLMQPSGAWTSIIGVLAVGFLLGSLGEGLFGRSPGKALTGCRVVRSRGAGAPGRAGLGRSILRNAIKWWAPPVAALTLVDPSGRGRADVLTGLAVVVDAEEDPASPGPGG